MKSFLTDTKAKLARASVFAIGCVAAGLGLVTVTMMAMVSLVIFGLVMLSRPFVRAAYRETDIIDATAVHQTTAAA